MGSRFPSHQLSSGLYVSGRPEQPKEKAPTFGSNVMPYTGGDTKKSGELGKMFELHAERSRKSGPLGSAPSRNPSFGGAASNSGPVSNAGGRSNYSGSLSSSVPGAGGSARAKSNSGPLNKHGEPVKRSSGPQSGGVTPMARQNSGPLPPMLPTTGLITSGPVTSGPLNSSGAPRRKVSGSLDPAASMKARATSLAHNQAVTTLTSEGGFSVMGSISKRGVLRFVNSCPDTDLRTAKDGEYVKVTGVVTCGNFPLESSFQRIPRCVYTSTRLYEYRGWDSKTANPKHRRFTWGLRTAERHAVDFYISDFQSGLRALVRTGSGARVTPYVDESVVIDVNPENKDMSPEFLRWLRERNLSSDGRKMRLKEGYIKEGSTVSVMGVVQKNESVLMIVPPSEPISSGCQWGSCFFPANLEGLVVRCEDTSDMDVIPV
ncbi:hypothetical protein ACQJBY_011436 [Aegilops geniculata]|uniref:Ubiquitin-specific protease family C19-related protein n=2 Tax=Triticinae TaxID=1648030 RepID=A0A453CTA1_AEGTS|nr:uncharacterized membrane protein At1g16860 isoform X2 [Aegilops tauschii subsp. strangulata]XP_044334077.1 uncharacterized membrane protein At1g16860-like isoform X2 [Triticum aestivum]XP_048558985.1 uncharacterized membrane protein At1g16860-like isoform X2 [Triticum urartu]VAH35965.1 unnamed protein product [Triticum turgidum subsp. durum]